MKLAALLTAFCCLATRALADASDVAAETVQAAVDAASISTGRQYDATGPGSEGCIVADFKFPCFVERVHFLEGLIMFGVVLTALLTGLTCLGALNTPTMFEKPKDRTD